MMADAAQLAAPLAGVFAPGSAAAAAGERGACFLAATAAVAPGGLFSAFPPAYALPPPHCAPPPGGWTLQYVPLWAAPPVRASRRSCLRRERTARLACSGVRR
jgi:hypothetical protein